MKRFLNIIMVISACMVLAVSCKEEDNVVSEFSIDKTEIAVGADGGSELLEIKGNVKWQGTSECSWLKFSPSNGEGAATCEVLVDSSVVAEPREGVITFMAAGQTTATTVKVMQMGYAKGVFVSEEDRTISVENSAKLEERFFEVTMMANVNFDVRVNNLPAEDGTVSDKEWLKYKKETPNYDYGDRPRLLKLHFDWEINMTEKARTAEVIITPQETSDTEGDGTIKLVVTQKPAPVITDDRAGDSLALLSIYSSMNGIFTWDASENMRYWKGVELWEATDKYIEIEENEALTMEEYQALQAAEAQAAREAGYDPVLGSFTYDANGMALAEGASGAVFVVMDKTREKTLGATIVGEKASEMIAFAASAVAKSMGAQAVPSV